MRAAARSSRAGRLQLATGAITAGQAAALTAPFVALTAVAVVYAAGMFRQLKPVGGK